MIKYFLNKHEKKYLDLNSKILNEFYYCDCLVPNINDYYNFELNLSEGNYKKINWLLLIIGGFKPLCHIFYLTLY